jgi:hypothetical protein
MTFGDIVQILNPIKIKAMHLKEKLVISISFVIQNFGTSVHALYTHNFMKFLLNYEAKLTKN